MNDGFIELGQAAVDGPIIDIAGIDSQVLEPGIRLALGGGQAALQVPTLPVRQPPTATISRNEFERWLRGAIRSWQIAANNALDRGTTVLKTAEDADLNGPLRNILSLSGALLSPISPWIAGVVSLLDIVLNEVIDRAPPALDLERFRLEYIKGVDIVANQFLNDIPRLVDELVRAQQIFNWTISEARENTLLRVLDAQVVKKTNVGLVSVDETRLRASIELGLLLHFAGTGQKFEGRFSGATIPFVVAVAIYKVTATHTENNGERTVNRPDRWNYEFIKFYLQTKELPGFIPRVRSLLRLLNEPLSLSTFNVPLSVTFDVSGSGRFEYVTRTSVWQPLTQIEIAGITQFSESIKVEFQGANDTLRVVEVGTLSTGRALALSSHISEESRYQGLTRLLSSDQIVGLVLMREAWGGPFPNRVPL